MAIETINGYYPAMSMPLYLTIRPPEHNSFSVGTKYDVRIEDPERQDEKGGSGVYNYVHEALLVAKHSTQWKDVDPFIIAFVGHSRSKDTAIERICPGGEEFQPDRPVEILVFLRLDAAKEFITEDYEPLTEPFEKEDVEGFG